MDNKLQPCPFCGAEAREVRYGASNDWFRIECGDAFGPSCCSMSTTFTDGSIAMLREKWNIRKPDRQKAIAAQCRMRCEITDIALCEDDCELIKRFKELYDNDR